jgi:predicted flap endonuclease-1-like 5' DNA nuclease
MELQAQELIGHGDEHGHNGHDEQDVEETTMMEQAGEEADQAEGDLEPGADDLTVIEGIGPKISQLLSGAGITRYAQLAIADPEQLDEIISRAGLHMADVSSWPDQAQLAMQGKWDELDALQDQLHGGREKEPEQE